MANYEEMINKANERGYEVHSFDPQHTWANLTKPGRNYPERSLGLQIWVESGEFELFHVIAQSTFTIRSGKCGSFMNDEHFGRFERQLREHLNDLYA